MRVIAAFSTANHYRLCEAKNFEDAQKQIVASLRVYRMLCDRDFFAEKVFAITMLSDSLSILRDIFYTYLDEMPGKIYQDFGREDIPFLQPTRNRLTMPEGDRIVSTGLIDLVFDENSGKADPQMFRKVFTDIQAESEPLTRFGAARRWEKVAALHSPRKEAHRHLILIMTTGGAAGVCRNTIQYWKGSQSSIVQIQFAMPLFFMPFETSKSCLRFEIY